MQTRGTGIYLNGGSSSDPILSQAPVELAGTFPTPLHARCSLLKCRPHPEGLTLMLQSVRWGGTARFPLGSTASTCTAAAPWGDPTEGLSRRTSRGTSRVLWRTRAERTLTTFWESRRDMAKTRRTDCLLSGSSKEV